MATATLYFYSTSFKTDENCIYDDLETYLATLTPLTISNFQYFKVTDDFERSIKIESSQSMLSQGMVFGYNYLKVVNSETGNIDYYYVTGSEWTSQYTIQVNLYFDVLNSLRSVTKFSDKTHITRRFKDRWEKYVTIGTSATAKVRPIVDDFPETIDTPVQIRTKVTAIEGSKWHLVYKTDYDSSTTVAENPVSVYAIPDSITTVNVGTMGDLDYFLTTLEAGVPYVMTAGLNDGEIVKFNSSTFTVGSNTDYLVFIVEAQITGKKLTLLSKSGSQGAASSISFSQNSKLYKSSGSTLSEYLSNFNTSDYVDVVTSTSSTVSLTTFSDWYQNNKTDSRIVKILALPYPPFTQSYSSSAMNIPTGWNYSDSGTLKLINPNTKFQNSAYSHNITLKNFTLTAFKSASRNDNYETKLYNSQFSTRKFVYDSNNWVYLPEYLTYSSLTAASIKIGISVNFATEMSSNIAFKFDAGSNMKYTSDYGEWMTSTRDLEVPFYTNEYLNYIRYGQSYDWKNMGASLLNNGVSGVGSTITTAATMTAIGTATTGIVGAVVGAATTIASLAISAAAGINSINAKIAQYKSQASSASTNNDLSIFTEMTSNQLQWMEYEPIDELKSAIARYFDYFGYATDEYGQMTDSRHWNDFYIAEVDFAKGSLLTKTAKDYIKQAYSEGVRIYHYDSGYDIDLLKNNYEVSLDV